MIKFYKNTKNFLNEKVKFISNQKRNTKTINKYIKQKKIDVILSVQHKWIIDASTINLVKRMLLIYIIQNYLIIKDIILYLMKLLIMKNFII